MIVQMLARAVALGKLQLRKFEGRVMQEGVRLWHEGGHDGYGPVLVGCEHCTAAADKPKNKT